MSKKLIFCFTFAGGTASFYDEIENYLVPDIRLVKFEYAGHGSRHREPLCSSFGEMVEDLYPKLKKILSEEIGDAGKTVEYSLMGYSMGSISVIEILRRILSDADTDEPKYVFLAAHEPFTKGEMLEIQQDKLDEYVKNRTIKFGGVPERLIGNEQFWRVYLPVYRADYLMIAKYRFESLNIRTEIPATVFYSEADTEFLDMEKWKNYFVGKCEFVEYAGTHFFIKDHCRKMAQVIRERLG